MPDASQMERKSFVFEIKDEARGEVVSVVATMGVVDRDGDVLLPGSFPPNTSVKLSAYGHDIITEGASPVGKGTISEEGDKAIFRGRFFMSTAAGREAFATVKELGEDGEWSFGFPRKWTKTAPMTNEWKARGARRVVSGLIPVEASPVFIGAGLNTGTVSTKEADDIPDPAIEAARVKAEEDAAAARAETERQTKAAEQLAAINGSADRMFKRLVTR